MQYDDVVDRLLLAGYKVHPSTASITPLINCTLFHNPDLDHLITVAHSAADAYYEGIVQIIADRLETANANW